MRPMVIVLIAAMLAVAAVMPAAPARAQSVSTPEPAQGQAPGAAQEMAIPPIVWNLIEFPGVGPITEQGRYTVQFLEDGQISAHADCNWVAGLWTAANGALDITITQSTLVGCPPDSLEQPFVLELHEATGYVLDGFSLTIIGPSGEMRFAPEMPAVA